MAYTAKQKKYIKKIMGLLSGHDEYSCFCLSHLGDRIYFCCDDCKQADCLASSTHACKVTGELWPWWIEG